MTRIPKMGKVVSCVAVGKELFWRAWRARRKIGMTYDVQYDGVMRKGWRTV